MNSVPKVAPKKPYQPPVLRVHGNVEALTAAGAAVAFVMDGIVAKTH